MVQLNFLRAKVSGVNTIALAALPAYPDYAEMHDKLTRFCLYDHRAAASERWHYRDLDFGTAGIAYTKRPEHSDLVYVLLSIEGHVYYFGTPPVTEIIPGTLADKANYQDWGRLSVIRNIHDNMYVCGDRGQIFIRRAGWSHLDKSLLKTAEAEKPDYFGMARGQEKTERMLAWAQRLQSGDGTYTLILNDINGLSDSDLYLCGSMVGHPWQKGRIYHWNGMTLNEVSVRTTNALTKIYVQNRDVVWICGRGGQLFAGNARDGFSLASGLSGEQLFSAITEYQGKIWIACASSPEGSALYTHDGTTLAQVRTPLEPDIADVFHVEATDGVLWAIGRRDIIRFDGTTWERIPHPDNPPL
jgi:hypothetical protein